MGSKSEPISAPLQVSPWVGDALSLDEFSPVVSALSYFTHIDTYTFLYNYAHIYIVSII